MEHRECSMSTLLKSHTLGQVSFLKCCNVTLRNIQRTLNKTTITTTVNCLNLSPLTSKSGPFFFFFCKTPRNKPYHVEIPPKRFHLNGHTMGFCPQIQNLELHTKQIVPLALRKRFRLNGHAIGFHPQAQKLNHLTKPITFSCSKSVTLGLEVFLRKFSRKTSWTMV